MVGYQQLYRTDDDGDDLEPVGPDGRRRSGPTSASPTPRTASRSGTSGSIAPANERLFYTTDGGQSYHRVPVP